MLVLLGYFCDGRAGVLLVGLLTQQRAIPALDGAYSIYQGHLFFQRATYGDCRAGCALSMYRLQLVRASFLWVLPFNWAHTTAFAALAGAVNMQQEVSKQ